MESGSYFPSPPDPIHSSTRHIDRSLRGPEALTEPRCSQSVWWDWGDWCHGVLEPLKCRPSVNMTKARPALSPGWDTLLTEPTTMPRSRRLILALRLPFSRNAWQFRQPVLIRYPQTNTGVQKVTTTHWCKVTGHKPHTRTFACRYVSGLLYLIATVLNLNLSWGWEGGGGGLPSFQSNRTTTTKTDTMQILHPPSLKTQRSLQWHQSKPCLKS